MAFNPFHGLRKYNKLVMSGMVLVAMLTFIFSWGQGDLFSRTWGNRSTTVVSVGGKAYDGMQVQHVRDQRILASRYMDLATYFVQNALAQKAQNGVAKLDPGAKPLVERIVQTRMYAQMLPQMFGEQYRSLIENSAMYRQFLRQYAVNAERDKKSEDLATIDAVEKMMDLDARVMAKQPGESYFGGNLEKDTDFEQLSNFLMWRYEADQLGITLNDSDIDTAVAYETFGELNGENAKQIAEALGRNARYSPESLRHALGEEFRVRMAQSSLMGLSQRLRRSLPAINTPEQSWDLFRDARTSITTGQIAIPVESYLASVKATPTKEDLEALYKEYKSAVPAPERAEPAFKEPRRIQVEWVAADAATPFYRDAAKKLAPISLAIAQIGGAASGLTDGDPTGVAQAIEATLPVAFADAPLYAELERYQIKDVPWTSTMEVMHDSSVLRAENFAILIGSALGAAGTGAPAALVGPLALEARATVREIRDRAKVGASFIMTAALDPIPLGVGGLPGLVMPKSLTLAALRDRLQGNLVENYTKKLLTEDATLFGREVGKLGKELDKAAVKKYIDDFVKARGWTRGLTTELRDQYNLADDAGLAVLKDAYIKGHGKQDTLLRAFAQPFFQEQTQFGPPIGVYTPQSYPAGFGDDKQYFFWRTEDRSERTPNFEKAKPQVEAAWKLQKARELAKADADKLMALAKAKGGNERELRDLAAANGNREFFKLGPMALRMPVLNPTPGQGRQYGGYAVPTNLIAYPGNELVTKLLDLRKDAIGATTVVSDQPQMHYYVASLLTRDEPNVEEFRTAFANSMTTTPEFDGLLLDLSVEGIRKYRNELMKFLRTEAKVTVNPEILKRDKDKTAEGQ
ncbi:MAG: hypothetical protein U0746_03965 [Gemmataceae bacterium]